MTATPSPVQRSRGPHRLSARVVDDFLERLARRELQPGERLPTERDLAATFDVGRNSIREAIRELEFLGVVESRHGDGTYVTEVDTNRLIGPFRSIVAMTSATVSIEQIFQFRMAIEPEAAALAAQNLDEESQTALERALRRFDQALSDDETGARAADTNFHFAIAQASGNALLIAVERAVIDALAHFRSTLAPSSYESHQKIPRGHHAIYGAIIARDADAARDAMREHLIDVTEALPDEFRIGPSQERA